jgi:hypothetical protein
MEDGLRRALTTPHKPLTKFKGKSVATGKRKPKLRPAHPIKATKPIVQKTKRKRCASYFLGRRTARRRGLCRNLLIERYRRFR